MISLALMLAGNPVSRPVPVVPLATLIGEDDYPPSARRGDVQGRVGFRLQVGADGRPDGCAVEESSGSAPLDDATCRLMQERARFVSATGPGGRAVRGSYSARVSWLLHDGREAVRTEQATIHLTFGPAGDVTGCTLTPIDAKAWASGCDEFGERRMVEALVGTSLRRLDWAELRIVKQVPGDPPPVAVVLAGAKARIVARSSLTIDRTGTVAACVDDKPLVVEGRSLGLCAIEAEATGVFVSSIAPDPRRLDESLEVVTKLR